MTISGESSFFVFDTDSYSPQLAEEAGASDMELMRVMLSRTSDSATYELLNTYYFQLRQSVTPVGDAAALTNKIAGVRQQLLKLAAQLTVVHQKTGTPAVPGWVSTVRQSVVQAVEASFPRASEIDVSLVQEPRLQCRALEGGRIVVSAFTREIYMHLSLAMRALTDDVAPLFGAPKENKSVTEDHTSDAPAENSFKEAEDTLIRTALPYFIFMNDVVPVSRLPQLGASDEGTFRAAHRGTQLQMQFLLAHEFGHLALGHAESPPRSLADALQREFDADRFGYRHVMTSLSEEDAQLFYPSFRWIFQIQQLDEIVGGLLRGRVRQVESLTFDQRKNELYEVLTKIRPISGAAQLREVAGCALLMSMKARLLALGSEDLRKIAEELSRDMTRGHQPAAWWEWIK